MGSPESGPREPKENEIKKISTDRFENGIDLKSYKVIDTPKGNPSNYRTDGKAIYYNEGGTLTRLDGVNLNDFVAVGQDFAEDKVNTFFKHKKMVELSKKVITV